MRSFLFKWPLSLILVLNSLLVAAEDTSEKVENGHFINTVRVTGKIIPLEGAMFVQAARVSGRLLEIVKHEGEHVKVGNPIYRISSAECASLYEESRVANERQLVEMISAVKKRQTRLDIKLDGEDCLLLSSFSGIITRRFLEPGANFNIGDPLAHIVDTSKVTMELEVPEKDSNRISVGKKVVVRLASDPDVEYTTKVQTVVPALDPMTRTTKVRIVPVAFKHPPTIESFVTADIETDSPEQTLIVPSAALVFYQSRQWVLKVGEGEKLVPVGVEVLSESGEKSSIRPMHGFLLEAGDKVITKGAVFAFKKLRNQGS